MNDIAVTCAKCGIVVFDDMQSSERTPCPNCGSILRNAHMTVSETIKTYDSVRVEHKDPSRKSKDKSRADLFSGHEKQHSTGKMIKKTRIIDKDHDKYSEEVVDPETNEVIHRCEEKLSEHRGHGHEKTKKKP
jgi:predicted RNA-binding Zn-ribbon protein involved in translation (DUF1610 family)